MRRQTRVGIVNDEFYINGRPTYAGITYRGAKIQGLLLNSRMVQGIFDDLNPETCSCGSTPIPVCGCCPKYSGIHRGNAGVEGLRPAFHCGWYARR